MFSFISCTATAGIAEWVCCPGAPNTPLYAALADCPAIHRWTMADDRAAAFFALGRVQATARPVVVVAGNGQSATSMMPAVVAAYYQRRPLIIVTIDGPDNTGGTGAPNEIEQEGIFGIHAPTVELCLPCPVSELPDFISLLSDGFPLHVRLRTDGATELPGADMSGMMIGEAPAGSPFRGSLVALSQMLRFRAVEGLVLMIGALEPTEQEPVLWLAQTLRVPVVADAASGLREELTTQLLHDAENILRQSPPRYILRVGDVPTTPFWKELENIPVTEVYSITRTGFSGLCRQSCVIEGDPEQIMKALGDVPHVGDTNRLLNRSRHAAGRTEEYLLAHPESAAAMVRAFSIHASLSDVICLGSPTCTRLWNHYAQLHAPTLYLRDLQPAGSDGVIATFLGNAADAPTACCLLGDITLLHDLHAPAILSQLPEGKRIIAVLNNEGAQQAREVAGDDPELQRLLVQAPAFSPEDIAHLWGAEYYRIHCESDLEVLDTLEDNAFVLLDLIPDND